MAKIPDEFHECLAPKVASNTEDVVTVTDGTEYFTRVLKPFGIGATCYYHKHSQDEETRASCW